jgi:hypothetical protein
MQVAMAVLLPVMGVCMVVGSRVLAEHWKRQRERQRVFLSRFRLTQWIPRPADEGFPLRTMNVFIGLVLMLAGVAIAVVLIQGG